MEKTGKAENFIMCAILAAMALFGVLFLLLPKKTFSENENRNLARFPEWKTEELNGGVYTGKIEKYLADHFPGRDTWMMIVSEADRLGGKQEINDVYLASDGRLIDIYQRPKQPERLVNSVVRFADALPETNIALMLVPTAQQVYEDLLPQFAPEERDWQLKAIAEIYGTVAEGTQGRVRTVDPAWSTERTDADSYYRTDHHWTVRGAKLAFDAWCSATGRPEKTVDEAGLSAVSDSFRGTTWSKLNDPLIAPDTILSYWDDSWDLTVTYTDTGEVTDTPYGEEWLSKKDKYAYYLNGLHPLLIIENKAVPEEQGAIAVIKDSYGNSMIPYMISDFRTIYVFDTRYWQQGVSSFVLEHEDIQEVLILYSISMIDTDAGIGGIF
ncbi:MAG: hypothetical protein IK016_09250 [Lachnospiraceae bacterium]|nr:hypothetical protein [Lachnospiraceae bacterium]